MAYPSDSGTTYTTKSNGQIIDASDVNNLQTEVTALKTKVGTNGDTNNASHDYKLSEVTSTDKAVGKTATQTITNKTLGTGTAITLGSDAEGDTYYRNASGVLVRLPRGTDNHILKMNGNVPNWEAETTITNASTTIAGIVEEATQSEADAQTATGGTGARLFLNPSSVTPSQSYVSLTAGESIAAGDALCSNYGFSDGGIIYDNKTTGTGSVSSAGGTVNVSFTVGSGSNRAMVLYVHISSSSGTPPTPTATYNSVSMTAKDTIAGLGSTKLSSFFLANPSSGTNNITITIGASSGTQTIAISATSYTGVGSVGTNYGALMNPPSYSYTVSNLGTVITSAIASTDTATANAFNNGQSVGTTPSIRSADSGQAFTSGTVSYNGSNISFCVIGLNPASTATGGYTFKASSSTPANGVNQNQYTAFIGFAKETVSAGQSVRVITDGTVSGLTSLTPTNTYYLNNTAGTIGTSAGSNSKKVGIALSTTQLLLKDTI